MNKPAPKLPKSLVRTATNAIGLAIVRGELPAGQVLPNEEQLAARFGVGRSALREAIKVLSGKGLVRTARRYGSRVCGPEEWNTLDPDVLAWSLSDPKNLPAFLHDLVEARVLLEPAVAMLAAQRATPEEAARIVALAAELPIVATEESVAVDIAFHVAVFRASHNRVFVGLGPALETLLRAWFLTIWKLRPDGPVHAPTSNLHQRTAAAIAAGDARGAGRYFRMMLKVNVVELENVLAEFEQSGGARQEAGAVRARELSALLSA